MRRVLVYFDDGEKTVIDVDMDFAYDMLEFSPDQYRGENYAISVYLEGEFAHVKKFEIVDDDFELVDDI